MNDVVDQVVEFLTESEFWAENTKYLNRSDVVHHEVNVDTNLDPLGIEFLFCEYMRAHNRDVRNVGHAVVGDHGYIKLYTVQRPIMNIVWRYSPDIVIGAPEDAWFTTWTDESEQEYLDRVNPRRATPSDLAAVDAYLTGSDWDELVLQKCADAQMEHFHAFIFTELHPYDLTKPFRDSLIAAGYDVRVPPFYLAQMDDHPLSSDGRHAMWIGLIPDGNISFEISCIHTPGVIIETKEMNADERLYGGDGWTIADMKEAMRKSPFQPFTLNEARSVVRQVAPARSLVA